MPKNPESSARSLAIELLGTCRSVSETARAVGRHRKTIARWYAQPKFAAAVAKRLQLLKHDYTAQFYAAIPHALDALVRNVQDADHPTAANAAAVIILRRTGMLTPDAAPRDEAVVEQVSLGGSLEVMTPEEAAKLQGGGNVIVMLPDSEPSPHADDSSGPRPDAEAHRPTP